VLHTLLLLLLLLLLPGRVAPGVRAVRQEVLCGTTGLSLSVP
jgi:hypothetical protein